MMIRRFLLFIFCFVISVTPVFADTSSPTDLSSAQASADVYFLEDMPVRSDSFKSKVIALIGSYTPVVTDYTYSSGGGYVSHSINVQPDYSWIFSSLILIVIIYCVFRLIGKFLCSR